MAARRSTAMTPNASSLDFRVLTHQESAIFKSPSARTMIESTYNLRIEDLESELTGADCHQIFTTMSRKTSCNEEFLIQGESRTASTHRTCPHVEVNRLVELLKEASQKKWSSPKRLIEVDLPIARISAHAQREKSIPAWAHFDAARLVGAAAVGGMPGGDLRRDFGLTRPISELPGGIPEGRGDRSCRACPRRHERA